MKWHSASAAAILASLSLADALSTRLAKRDDTIKVFKFRVSAPTYPDIDGTYISLKDSVAGIYTAPATLEANPQARNPLMVYASRGANDSDTFSLGVCPIGFVPHTLALVGTPGNLEMTDLVNPASQTFPEGTTVKWGGWKLEGVPAFGADGSSTASADSGSGSAKPPTSYGSVKGRMRLRGVGVTAAKLAGRQIAPKKGSGGPGTMRSGTGAARAEGGRVTYSDGPNSRWLAFPTGTRGDWRVRWHDGAGFILTTYMPIEIFYEEVEGNLSEICPM